MKLKPALRLCGLFLAVLIFTACTAPAGKPQNSENEEPAAVGGSTRRSGVSSDEMQFLSYGEDAVRAEIETSRGTISFVLFPQYAPLAVENFCTLAKQGYYDGTTIHRVVRDFVIQGGDPTGTGLGGTSIWGTPFATERSNFLHHYSGALCMAAANEEENTNESQFYVVATPQNSLDDEALQKLRDAGMREEVVDTYRQAGGAPYLDYKCTVFGQVVDGMDIVDTIARAATDEDGKPKTTVTVEKVTIYNYG